MATAITPTVDPIERAITDRALDDPLFADARRRLRTGRFVAVVGAGPAGLAAASWLNWAGHFVTVFERAPRIDVRDEHLSRLVSDGIVLRPGVDVGLHIPADWLRDDYNAIVLAIRSIDPGAAVLLTRFDVRRTESGEVWCDDRYMTSAIGVFAAGAMRQVDSTIGTAISEGRRAARAVDLYLRGTSDLILDAPGAAPVEPSRRA